MSSIMDELKTLQSERGGPNTPGAGLDAPDSDETGPREPPPGGTSRLRALLPERWRHLGFVLGLGVVLGALAAALVLPGRGRKSQGPTIARVNEQPDEGVLDVGEGLAPNSDQLPDEATAPETVAEPAVAEAEAHEATEPNEKQVAAAGLDNGGGPAASEAAGDVAESPEEPPKAEESEPLTAAAEEAAAGDVEQPPKEGGVPEPVEEAAPPVRVLTKAEDEANKAAIRGLKVFGVLVDQKGAGVYTSAGQLRAGSRFNDMVVKEVTCRYVVFESGNKRYKWMLPR